MITAKSGVQIGNFTLIEFSHKNKWRAHYWKVKCVCGNEKIMLLGHVRANNIKSCGCLRYKEGHNQYYTGTYKSWLSMIQRCTNPNESRYKRYGGRGITIHKSWKKFENFYADMGDRPENTTLDRIDNDGDYTPKNCRWATADIQNQNRSSYIKR